LFHWQFTVEHANILGVVVLRPIHLAGLADEAKYIVFSGPNISGKTGLMVRFG